MHIYFLFVTGPTHTVYRYGRDSYRPSYYLSRTCAFSCYLFNGERERDRDIDHCGNEDQTVIQSGALICILLDQRVPLALQLEKKIGLEHAVTHWQDTLYNSKKLKRFRNFCFTSSLTFLKELQNRKICYGKVLPYPPTSTVPSVEGILIREAVRYSARYNSTSTST